MMCATLGAGFTKLLFCSSCAIGTYNARAYPSLDVKRTTSCIKCPQGRTTKGVGEGKSGADCRISCVAGQYLQSIRASRCSICPAGRFASATVTATSSKTFGLEASCTHCPAGKTSSALQIYTQSQCNVRLSGRCKAATSSAQGCPACAAGFYNEKSLSLRTADCKQCPKGKTTNSPGKTAKNCYCAAGW